MKKALMVALAVAACLALAHAATDDVAVGAIPKVGAAAAKSANAAAAPAPATADADAATATPAVGGIDETAIPKVGGGKAADDATASAPAKATTTTTTTKKAAGSADEPATSATSKTTAAAATSSDPSIAAAATGLAALEVPDGSDGAEVDGITAPEKIDADRAGKAKSTPVPLDGFEPAWTEARPASSVITELVTDTPLEVVKTNQIPLIQSLAAAANTPPNQVYFYKLAEGDPVNLITFLIDTKDETGRQGALRSLADGAKTAKFYSNAKAFKVNVVNGPSVPAGENVLDASSISTPDDKSHYNLDTGEVTNNQTKFSSSAGLAGVSSSPASALFVVGLTTLVAVSLALTA